eukprot:366396-Chlamydomonas_euryale.AAC.2
MHLGLHFGLLFGLHFGLHLGLHFGVRLGLHFGMHLGQQIGLHAGPRLGHGCATLEADEAAVIGARNVAALAAAFQMRAAAFGAAAMTSASGAAC